MASLYLILWRTGSQWRSERYELVVTALCCNADRCLFHRQRYRAVLLKKGCIRYKTELVQELSPFCTMSLTQNRQVTTEDRQWAYKLSKTKKIIYYFLAYVPLSYHVVCGVDSAHERHVTKNYTDTQSAYQLSSLADASAQDISSLKGNSTFITSGSQMICFI